MPEQEAKTGEMDEAEEVLDVVLPTSDEAAEVVHPSEETFYLPTSAVAAQLSSVLGLASGAPTRGDQLDAVVLFDLLIQPIRVVGFVPNESGGQLFEEASSQDQLAFVRRSALHRHGEGSNCFPLWPGAPQQCCGEKHRQTRPHRFPVSLFALKFHLSIIANNKRTYNWALAPGRASPDSDVCNPIASQPAGCRSLFLLFIGSNLRAAKILGFGQAWSSTATNSSVRFDMGKWLFCKLLQKGACQI